MTDPYQRYADHFGIERESAKAILFGLTYHPALDPDAVEAYVDRAIALSKADAEPETPCGDYDWQFDSRIDPDGPVLVCGTHGSPGRPEVYESLSRSRWLTASGPCQAVEVPE